MKIRRVEALKLRIPTKIKYEEAGGTYSSFVRSLVVRIYTDGELVGIGEAHESVPGYTAETLETMHAVVENSYGPALLGLELEAIEALHKKMVEVRRGNNFARCAIEVALFDALARTRGTGVASLLGGPVRTELALVGGIGIEEPELMAEMAVRLVGAGYRTIKLKIGTADVRRDLLRVQKVRAAIGDGIPIRVDANAGYMPTDAMIVARGLGDLGIEHFEQPVAAENLEAMARLLRLGAVSVLADESVHTAQDAVRLISAQAADGIKIKISKVGGYIEARKIIDVAEAAGIKLIIGNGICSSVEAASEIHLACAYPHVCPVAEMVGPMKLLGDIASNGFDMSRGTAALPTGPGLGVELSEDSLQNYLPN